MDFKEYYRDITGETNYTITGLRIFIFLSSKAMKETKIRLENDYHFITMIDVPKEFKTSHQNWLIPKLKNHLEKLSRAIDKAVQEILKLDNGVLELEDLLGKELFNEIYKEESFKEEPVKMTIEDAEQCNQCKEWFGVSELKINLCNECYPKVLQ